MVRDHWDWTKTVSETKVHDRVSYFRRGRMMTYGTTGVQLYAFLALALDKHYGQLCTPALSQIQSRCFKKWTSCLHRELNHDSKLIQPTA